MSLDADAIVDRRRTRRKLFFWRAAAFLALAGALLGGAGFLGLLDDVGALKAPHIARITVSGVIVEDKALTDLIAEAAEADSVEAIIIAIDSPGGSTSGGEGLYDAIRKAADAKPTAATVGTMATSAGYMAAIATDHIVALRTSITGSIGVYFQYGNVVPLLDKIGVSIETVKSAPLKAEPSPFTREEVPGAREAIARLVNDTYDWFVDIVAERRRMPRPDALRLADGTIYTGRQALELKLVDAIGGEDAAIAWFEERRNVPKDLPVEDWSLASAEDPLGLGGRALAALSALAGLDLGLAPEPAALDGLVSVWHPQLLDNQ